MRREPVAPEASRGRRLHDDERVRRGDQVHDGIAPAAVMRELQQIAREHRRVASRGDDEPRRGLRLDVPREEDASEDLVARRAGIREQLDSRDERAVVRPPRRGSGAGPEEPPSHPRQLDGGAFLDRPHTHAGRLEHRQQLVDRRCSPTGLEKRPVHDHLADADRPHQVDDRAEVIEVRVTQHDEVDPLPASLEPWQQGPRAGRAVARRAGVEQGDGRTALDDVHRSVADGDRRDARLVGRARGDGCDCRAHDHAGSDCRRASPPPAAEDDGGDHRRDERDGGRTADRPDRDRPSEVRETPLDESDLHRGRRPDERSGPGDERRPCQSEDRLRIRDDQGGRREWRAHQREQRAEGLHGAEMHQDDRCARQERRGRGRDGRTGRLSKDADERRRRVSQHVARKPAEPSRPDGSREVTEREHASEAELESGVHGERRLGGQQCQGRRGEDRVAVPVPVGHGASRADKRHHRRSHGARGWRHQDERAERRAADRDRVHAPVAGREPRHGADDPAEDGEVEARDREDVRESDRSERALDGPVSVLAVSEDERHEHGTHDRWRLVGHTREKRFAQPCADRLADPGEIAREGTFRPWIVGIRLDPTDERRRVDRERRDDAAPRGDAPRIDVTWQRIAARAAQEAGRPDAVADTDPGQSLADRDGDAHLVRTADRNALAIVADDVGVPDGEAVPRRLVEVPGEHVGREPALDGHGVDGAFHDHDRPLRRRRDEGVARLLDRFARGARDAPEERRDRECGCRGREREKSLERRVELDRVPVGLAEIDALARSGRVGVHPTPRSAGIARGAQAKPFHLEFHLHPPDPARTPRRHDRDRGEQHGGEDRRGEELAADHATDLDGICVGRTERDVPVARAGQTPDEARRRDHADRQRPLGKRVARARSDPKRQIPLRRCPDLPLHDRSLPSRRIRDRVAHRPSRPGVGGPAHAERTWRRYRAIARVRRGTRVLRALVAIPTERTAVTSRASRTAP